MLHLPFSDLPPKKCPRFEIAAIRITAILAAIPTLCVRMSGFPFFSAIAVFSITSDKYAENSVIPGKIKKKPEILTN